MSRTLIKNSTLVNEGRVFKGSLVIKDQFIEEIVEGDSLPNGSFDRVIDGANYYVLPGVIDDHVHFRDPGLTQKGDILSESKAAAAGGVTSIMDMPNTNPQTVTIKELENKWELMAEKSVVNYSCYFGATNKNYVDFKLLDKSKVCGIKLFMGASTGNMLVDRIKSLENIFNSTDLLIATHCENHNLIKENTLFYKDLATEEDLPMEYHPKIRSEQACFESTKLAVDLAKKFNAKLHVLHLSTAKELELFTSGEIAEKKITAEACISHLIYSDEDYESFDSLIKCNPSIKKGTDREALREAVNNDVIDLIATDHAPHLLTDKEGGALKAASGIPTIQFSLINMLELVSEGVFSIEKVVHKMAHAPALLFNIDRRGFLRPGYFADFTLVERKKWKVSEEQVLSKCGWSPFTGKEFSWRVIHTFINGNHTFNNGVINSPKKGQQLIFK